MVKKILTVLALLSLRSIAAAQPFQAQTTVDIMTSTQTCSAVSVSSFTPTMVLTSTNVPNGAYRYVAVQNLDSSNDLNCSDDVGVSTQSASVRLGFDVAKGSPGATVVWTLVPGEPWYCLSKSQSGSSTAIICKGR